MKKFYLLILIMVSGGQLFAKGNIMTKADDREGIEGMWVFQLGDYYNGTNNPIPTNDSFITLYNATIDGDRVLFLPEEESMFPFIGTYNPDNSTLLFQREMIGEDKGSTQTYYVYQESFVFSASKGLTIKDIYGVYNEEDGIITFEPDNGILWAAYNDKDGKSMVHIYQGYDYEASYFIEPGDDSLDWTDLGEATFMDGWILPALGVDQTLESNQYKVPLQQNKNNPNLYRIVGPYQTGPAARYNENPITGYIEFDISDPLHVVFNKVQAGFTNSSLGIAICYCYNKLGSLLESASEGTDVADIVSEYGDKIPYTVFENGVVSLSYVGTNKNKVYDANIGTQAQPSGGMTWSDNRGNQANMVASITLPEGAGIGEIAEEGMTPAYYNLQGLKVDTPEKGQILIKREGNKSRKIIF